MERTSPADAPDAGAAAPEAPVEAPVEAPLAPGLYVVATPIGNAGDVTLRALDALRRADVIAAEDTRAARRLMEMHGVPLGGRALIAYHDHNGERRRPELLRRLAEGASVALVAEAGTPMISDPGYKLAREAAEAGHAVTALPGASALLAALCVAGLPTDRFMFAGFLPTRRAARRAALAPLAAIPATLVFYEAPRRLAESLADMAAALGPARQAAICRELTKRFEEVRRGALGALAAELAAEPAPRGEAVVVVGPPAAAEAPRRDENAPELDAALSRALKTMSVKDAAREVAAAFGLPRKTVYARALDLARGDRPAADAPAPDEAEDPDAPDAPAAPRARGEGRAPEGGRRGGDPARDGTARRRGRGARDERP
ncbi:16S rRNA (cytidine1402-2'-O)-methyltransferase [Oceanicella actignis]|nr:16S rRNA (cytidine1402-2'-O)-methyltransferase [Oceanicella actignis]